MEKRHTGGGRELGCTSVQVSQTEALNTRHIGNKTTERLDTFDQLSASLRQHKMGKICAIQLSPFCLENHQLLRFDTDISAN